MGKESEKEQTHTCICVTEHLKLKRLHKTILQYKIKIKLEKEKNTF